MPPTGRVHVLISVLRAGRETAPTLTISQFYAGEGRAVGGCGGGSGDDGGGAADGGGGSDGGGVELSLPQDLERREGEGSLRVPEEGRQVRTELPRQRERTTPFRVAVPVHHIPHLAGRRLRVGHRQSLRIWVVRAVITVGRKRPWV